MQTGAVYIRVSTNDQTEFSPDAQKRQIMDYASKNNILISNEFIFIDEGISGRKAEKRPEFMRMIATAKKKPKPFDVILVHKFDRFARSREDSIVYKSLLRKECNIRVISITEQIEDDKFSVILEAMLEAMAEYYSLNLSDEVMKGMTEKALRGEFQSTAPLGYIMESGKLVVDSEKAQLVKLIYDEYLNKNSSPFKIARMLNSKGNKTNRGNFFESRTIIYMLKNPVYAGYVRWNVLDKNAGTVKDESDWIIKKGDFEVIIDEKSFNLVQEKMKKSYRPMKKRPSEFNKHWLSGVLKCSSCGKTLVYSPNKTGFQCWLYSKGKCSISHWISEEKIIKAILKSLEDVLKNQDLEYTVINESKNKEELKLLTNELQRLSQKEKRAKDAYLNEIDTLEEYKLNKSIIQKEKRLLDDQIEGLNKIASSNTKDKMLDKIRDVYMIINSESQSKESKNAAITSVISDIIYSRPNNSIEVHYYY